MDWLCSNQCRRMLEHGEARLKQNDCASTNDIWPLHPRHRMTNANLADLRLTHQAKQPPCFAFFSAQGALTGGGGWSSINVDRYFFTSHWLLQRSDASASKGGFCSATSQKFNDQQAMLLQLLMAGAQVALRRCASSGQPDKLLLLCGKRKERSEIVGGCKNRTPW